MPLAIGTKLNWWTPDEDQVLRDCYDKGPAQVLALSIGRSVHSIRHRAKVLGLKTGRFWSPEQDARLREAWGNVKSSALARELGRSPSAIKQRAIKLGLDANRYYTDEEKALIRELYPTTPATEIARRIHGNSQRASAIYRMAFNLGLTKQPRHPDELIERVKQLHAEGLNDKEIADRLGMDRDIIHPIRYERLKLPGNEASILQARRRGVKTQQKRLGIRNSGELRALAYRRFAAENGWPEDLCPREVQPVDITDARPGSTEKLAVLEQRLANGEALFSGKDGNGHED